MTNESRSWIVGCLRAGCVFAICTVLGIIVRQHPKFFLNALFAVMTASVFALVAWIFRPPTK